MKPRRGAQHHHDLGEIALEKGRLEEAEAQFRRALHHQVDGGRPGRQESEVAATWNNLGIVLRGMERMAEAEEAYREALSIQRRLAEARPKRHDPALAAVLNNLGAVLRALHRPDEAVVMLKEALDLYRPLAESRPKRHLLALAKTARNVANTLRDLGRLEESDAAYAETLSTYERLSKMQPGSYEDEIATILNDWSNVLRRLGRPGDAEDGFRASLAITQRYATLDPEAYGPRLATIRYNLALTLQELDRPEEALEVYDEALRGFRSFAESKPEAHEGDLAATLNNRAIVLRALGRPEEGLEGHQEALPIYRRLVETRPEEYLSDLAACLNGAGNVLVHLGRPDEAVRALREAVAIYEDHLSVLAQDLAAARHNLATALRGLRRFEEAEELLREAAATYRPLAGTEPEEYELILAETLNQLGMVLVKLDRFPDAKTAHEESLEIVRRLAARKPGEYDVHLAASLNNLGLALRNLRRFTDAERAYAESLEISRRLPNREHSVAATLSNVGSVLLRLGQQEDALAALREAEKLLRHRVSVAGRPEEPALAKLLNNVGYVLRDLGRSDEAVEPLREAVERIERHDEEPDLRAAAHSNLGRALMDQGRWDEAVDDLREAVKNIEGLRGEVLSLDRRLAILRENTETYEALVVCLMKTEPPRYSEALEVAERGKSRTLVDLLTLRDLRPRNAPEEVAREYERMLFRARALEDQLRRDEEPRAGEAEDPPRDRGDIRSDLAQATGRLRKLAEVIQERDPDFLPHAAPLTSDDILDLAQEGSATLVLFRVTSAGTYAFLVLPSREIEVVEVPGFTTETHAQILLQQNEDHPREGWVARYYLYQSAVRRGNREEIELARGQWLEGMNETLGVLYEKLLQPVHDVLRARGARDVVLVPNRGLAILPLHACWWKEGGTRRYLLDEFTIRYAPSLSVFRRCLERESEGRQHDTLLAVANPGGDLEFSDWECEEIERIMGHDRTLVLRERASEAEVRRWAGQRHVLHFSCHGQYLMDRPLDSLLHLAGGETLTMGRIFEDVHLPESWLVSLSACETGLVDFREVADEHFGLPMAFLYAGVPTVFASLWMVNDLSTALLMTKAYDGVITDKKDKAHALRDAQLWVRDLTAADIVELLQGEGSQLAPVRAHYKDAYDATDHPFAHPYWWAAFQCVGA